MLCTAGYGLVVWFGVCAQGAALGLVWGLHTGRSCRFGLPTLFSSTRTKISLKTASTWRNVEYVVRI